MRTLGTIKTKPRATKAPKGFVFYKGRSSLDGKPIVVIGTLETSNKKTGEMVQVWILRDGVSPTEAVKTGEDASVCGSCPHRHHTGGACYVNVGHAPRGIYDAYTRGLYPMYDPAEHERLLRHRKIRLGAYGDPAAAPYELMNYLAGVGIGHTGYTHQARHKNFDERFLSICMVSADSPKQAQQWHEKGARTFRVAMQGDGLFDNEIECLADSMGMTCHECGLCDGNKRDEKNIVIAVHGARQKRFKTATLIPTLSVA